MRSQKIIHKSVYTKSMSLLLIIAFLFAMIPAFGISALALDVSAQTKYEKLWTEKLAYENTAGLRFCPGSEDYGPLHYGDLGGEGGDVWGIGYDFLLFTEKGQTLTFYYLSSEIDIHDRYDYGASISSFGGFDSPIDIVCKELKEYHKEIELMEKKYDVVQIYSVYRYIVQKLGITADELREAYRKMKEEPEFARNILTEMPDAEFELYKNYLKELTIPENFMIEAYCMEDDAKAESLLNIPGMVYVKELGYSIYAYYIFMYPHIPVEDVLEFDLTTDSFSLLLNDVKDYFEYEDCYYVKEGAKDDQGRTPRQRLDLIMQNRIKQLANPKTGEAWYFIPVAAVSLVAGIFVICPRRKRMLEG